MTTEKLRVDALMVQNGFAESRSKAQSLIEAGCVFLNDKKILKPSQTVLANAELRIEGLDHPWVSRGGVKLAYALQHFKIKVSDRVALDIGASTGGFTDVLLQSGAAFVVAIDVGQDQLAKKIKDDPRVIILDKTNARYLTAEDITKPFDLIVCDASFISLMKLLPSLLAFAPVGTELIALIKPQFEVGKENIPKDGVVKSIEAREKVCQDVQNWLKLEMGWDVLGLTQSPIQGPEGNVEFLIHAQKNDQKK